MDLSAPSIDFVQNKQTTPPSQVKCISNLQRRKATVNRRVAESLILPDLPGVSPCLIPILKWEQRAGGTLAAAFPPQFTACALLGGCRKKGGISIANPGV